MEELSLAVVGGRKGSVLLLRCCISGFRSLQRIAPRYGAGGCKILGRRDIATHDPGPAKAHQRSHRWGIGLGFLV